jgi:hypothetical protein
MRRSRLRPCRLNEAYPRIGFIVTNLARPAERVVAFYNQRGTAEQWIKGGKGAIKWTRLSCRTFAANAVRLQLHALAYNLANFTRTLAMPKTAEPWSLTSLRERVIKIGARVTSHGCYVTFQIAEIAVPRQMFVDILSLIARLRAPLCASMREQRDQMRQAATAKVCLDLAKSGRFTVAVLSNAGLNRPLLALSTICRCPSRSKERSWPRNRGNLANVGLKQTQNKHPTHGTAHPLDSKRGGRR